MRTDLRISPAIRVTALAVVALACVAAFATVGVTGGWSFAVPFRLRKVAAMVVVAIAIGVSTVVFQTVTANRILTPSIMGFDALYVLIQTVVVFAFGAGALATASATVSWLVEVGAMVAFSVLLFRWIFAGPRRRSVYLLVLVGIVFGVLFRSLSGLLQRMLDPASFAMLQDTFFASFNAVDRQLLVISTAAVAITLVALSRMLPVLDVLALGESHATGLGVDYRRTVTLLLVAIAVLVAVSTALVGPITFFGLLVANVAYGISGTHRHRVVLPVAVLLGIICLIGGQLLLEYVLEFDTALSVVIEFVGGIVFIVLLLQKRVR